MIGLRNILRKIWRPLRGYYSKRRQRLAAERSARHLRQQAINGRLLDEMPIEDREVWSRRIGMVIDARHNTLISRCRDAGRFRNDLLVMHNDQVISPLSYYSKPMLQMLVRNLGVHEPEEEYIFSVVLRHLSPDATMLELGAYWAFYSMWFLRNSPNRQAFLVEPDPENLKSGITNFRLNGLSGTFVEAFVSSRSSTAPVNTICVDDFVHERGIEKLDILHCDIQGYEFEMLQGATSVLSRHLASCVFISTHSNELHFKCRDSLLAFGYTILRDTDLDHTSSYDGLLFACTPAFAEQTEIRKVLRHP